MDRRFSALNIYYNLLYKIPFRPQCMAKYIYAIGCRLVAKKNAPIDLEDEISTSTRRSNGFIPNLIPFLPV